MSHTELEQGQQLILGNCREKKAQKDIRLDSFSHRIVGTWNDLPPNAKAITAPANFKREL